MNWYYLSKQSQSVDARIKHIIRTTPFFRTMFDSYGVRPQEMMDLTFSVDDLEGRHAESRGDCEIVLDRKKCSCGIHEVMHMVAHELSHWLTRKKEAKKYFSDPEEVRGFQWGIAYEIARGKSYDDIVKMFLPLLTPHFKNKSDAGKAFVSMLKGSKKILKRRGAKGLLRSV